MNEEVVHLYNVITGKICCGADLEKIRQRTVFPDFTTCPACKKACAPDHKDAETSSKKS